MKEYKKRLISVLPNTDETLFAVYYYEDSERGMIQAKVKIKFIAFYEEKWNNDSEWEIRSFYLTDYEGLNNCIHHAEDSSGFLDFIGGGTEYIELDKSEYLPIPKKKAKTTTV